jgi:peptidoglycan/LPS O-acetylase OafA/YrhL
MGGCLLAYLMHTGWRPGKWTVRIGYPGWAFLALLVAFGGVSDPWLYHGGYTIVAFACTAVVLLAVVPDTAMAKLLAIKPLQAVGRRTYSLYIMHYLIYLAVVRAYPNWSAPGRLALGLGLTVVVSEITHRVLERPFLNIKNRHSDHAPPEEISTHVIPASEAV